MSMTRITAAIRDHIVSALLAKKYVEQDLELQRLQEAERAAEEAMEKLAYEAAFTAGQRKFLQEAPDGYFPKASNVKIRIANKDNADNYSDEYVEFGEEKPVFFRNSHYVGMFAAVIDSDHPYVKAREAYRDADRQVNAMGQDLRQKRRADRVRIETIVNSVTTVKRLQEIWPEVIDYLPETVSGPEGSLPAEIIADLNKDFGLTK